MTPEDHELFKKHMPLYESYKKHAFIRNYSKEVYSELLHLYTTYVNAKHNFSHWCSSCRMELVNYLYGWYTNEEHTTWYRQQEEEAAALLAAQAIEPTPEPKKRTRKTSTK
jgi:elongation factor P hydroxylase